MNKTVLRLAHQTAVILESVCKSEPVTYTAAYFRNLGINIPVGTQLPANSDNLDLICAEINSTLNHFEKVRLLLIVQDCLLMVHDNPLIMDGLNQVFKAVGIESSLLVTFKEFLEQNDVLNISSGKYLLLSPQGTISNEMLEGRWIEDNVPKSLDVSANFELAEFKDYLLVMFVKQIRSYVIRCINKRGKLFDEDQDDACMFRILKPGDELCIHGVPVVTFSDLKSRFLHLIEKRELSFFIDHIQYTNSSGKKEIHSFSARETTGQLIGIVGREGVGKSSLLKLLAGKFKPESGNIFINGYDLWKYKYLLKGIIGFVPEEDLLFEELSVADNLALTARLYYSNLNKKEIDARVNALLSRLDLIELKHVVVGKHDSKHIQPGQRRLINIALELLREPQILLVDNALSGLGMSDACKVINVLHDYSFAGNLVITSISQVDSTTFQLFDKIWILDEGGYPVYNGSVKAAPGYLFKHLKITYENKEIADPALLLDWINYRLPDKDRHVWKRVISPKQWHDQFLMEQVLYNNSQNTRNLLPARILKTPNLEVQLLIFSIRNFKCKFSRIHEIIKTLLTGPLIGILVAFLLRTGTENGYNLLENGNLPLFQFISVIVAIFLGLISGIDEINREKNILEKEEYQEFSRFSYLNSKILYLFPIIALQVVLYVLTANLIFGIRELFWVYWIVLFSSGCFGVVLGLLLSARFENRTYLYKAVLPVILVLQVLLSGGMVSFDKLNLGDHKYTPFVADLMTSRWGYEALAVEQFKNNSFEKLIYEADKNLDQAAFYAFEGVPKLEQILNSCLVTSNSDTFQNNLALLRNEMIRIASIPDVFGFEFIKKLDEIRENEEIAESAGEYLIYLGRQFYEKYDTMVRKKSVLMHNLADSIGKEKLTIMRTRFHNMALEAEVVNNEEENSYNIIDNQIFRKTGNIYQNPRSEWGRAAFYSPSKQFGGQKTDTLWFNISMIWMLTSFCYIWVLFDFSGLIRSTLSLGKKIRRNS